MRSNQTSVNDMQFNFSRLKHPIQIFEMVERRVNGIPQKPTKELFYECFAHIETVSLRDYATSVQTNTQHDLKIFIRNYPNITNKMTIEFDNQNYNIKQIMYNYRNSGFSVIVAEGVSQ